jgi:hypothetical protein
MSVFDDGGDSLQQATRKGTLRFASTSSLAGATGFLSPGETVDWYQVKAKGRSSQSVNLSLSATTSANQTIEIFFRAPNKTQGRGKRIATVGENAVDQRNLKALPGTYFIKVSQTPGTVPDEGVYICNLVSVNIGTFSARSKKAASPTRSAQSKDLFF